jgi:hypothetical protein
MAGLSWRPIPQIQGVSNSVVQGRVSFAGKPGKTTTKKDKDMAIGEQTQGDLAPHGAVVHIAWEVHERQADGKYSGTVKDSGSVVLDIKADDRALAIEYVDALIRNIKENVKNVSITRHEATGFGESQVSGTGRPRPAPPRLYGMRGTTRGNPPGRPTNPGNF